jgi:uncharacterized protein (DUF1778 family)
MAARSTATEILSVRLTAEERALLEAAARQSHATLSDFVRRRALESAEIAVLDRNVVTIPAKDSAAFEAWLDRPAEPVAALAALARRKPSWER